MHGRHSPARVTIPLAISALLIGGAIRPAEAAAQQPGDEPSHEDTGLGAVHFTTSCSPAVQSEFERGVALLHHMMYVEARHAFESVAASDPACAMAQWGIAMTLFQPLWPTRPGPDELKRGWDAVRKAGELGAATDRERALLAAAEAFYRDPETAGWWERIGRWAEAMETAYAAHPDDNETAAFYALSRLAAGYVAEDRLAHNARAAAVLAGILEKEPSHPGAIHYTIHANDVDGRAGESLEVVRSYDEIAPTVPHALHMPTHIFVRLGDWPEVIRWNRKSADAALRFPAGDAVSHHYAHAMDYLLYARLQRGEDAEAGAILEEAMQKEKHQPGFTSAFHLAAMPARWAVERRDWTEAAATTARARANVRWDEYPWAEGLSWFARGLGAARTGNLGSAREAEARLAALRDRAEASGERDFGRYLEIDRRILAGWVAWGAGDAEAAVALLREATELEGTVQKHPVSPGSLLPAHEALGELLLEAGRPAEALAAFEASNRVWPGRFHTLAGAARAAEAAGERDKAGEYYAELLRVVAGASTERPAIGEAQAFLATGG